MSTNPPKEIGLIEIEEKAKHLSPLELFHPKGQVNSALVIGSNCPSSLTPGVTRYSLHADLVVLAPTVEEYQSRGWLEASIRLALDRLDRDGVLYVLVRPRWRRQVRKLLGSSGLRIEESVLHLPNFESSQFLIPLHPGPFNYACSNLFVTRPWRRRLTLAALHSSAGTRALSDFVPSVGLVGRRQQASPILDWLAYLDNAKGANAKAVISVSWSENYRSFVLLPFSESGARPSAVVKLPGGMKAGPSAEREADIMTGVGVSASDVGVRVPKVVRLASVGGRTALVETVVQGQSAATLLASNPSRFPELIQRTGSMLEKWNLSTRTVESRLAERAMQGLIADAKTLSPLLKGGAQYSEWVQGVCASQPVLPLAAAHNDLTAWNILLDESGALGIVDWSEAATQSLPLVDFFYTATDMATIALRLKRLDGFRACFSPDGAWIRVTRPLLIRLQLSLEISSQALDLGLHGCFLHHAVNEQSRGQPDRSQPFLQIVEWLAQNRAAVGQWIAQFQ